MQAEGIQDIMPQMLGRKEFLKDEILSAKVVVVDDIGFNRKLLDLALKGAGFENVHLAANGQETLELVNKIEPDLLLLDWNLPGMSGIDVCKILRQDEKTADIPIIMQTAMETDEDRNIAFSAGATDYICKPLNIPELLARVCIHLENRLLIHSLSRYQKRVDAELSLAREMQEDLLPCADCISELSEKYGLKIEGYSKESSELGGDIWGLISLSENQLGFFLLDVSGHGVSAALNTFRFHQEIMQMRENVSDPADVLVRINDHLAPRMPIGQFATILYGIVNINEETLTYASAAQPAPFHIESGKVQRCESRGFFVGMRPNVEYESHTIPFKKGDSFFTYSDALIETKNEDGVLLGEDGIHTYLKQQVEEGKADNYFDPLLQYFNTHYGKNLRDDLTLLSITRI